MKLCLPPAINKNKMQKYFTSHFVDSKVNLQVHNKKVILDQKWTFETCFMNDFWKENDLDGSQGDLRSLGHPQRPRQAQPWGVQQVPFIFIKMNIWNMFHERFSKTKRPGWVPRWSEGSRTPSATLTSSTMGSTASTIYIHKNEHLKHVSWTIFEKKTIWMGLKGI